jgi:hypothetical protein
MTTSMSTDTKSRTTIFLLIVNFLQLYKTHFYSSLSLSLCRSIQAQERFCFFFAFSSRFRDNVKIIFFIFFLCRFIVLSSTVVVIIHIGKMFKSAELPWLITFFQMFYNDKPVDWLLEHLIYTKVCNWEKDMVRKFKKCFKKRNFFTFFFHSFLTSFRNIANMKKLSFGFTISLHSFNTSV